MSSRRRSARGRLSRWLLAAAVAGLPATVALVLAGEEPAERPAVPVWTVDPQVPGPDLPPVGRSVFDFLVDRRAGAGGAPEIPFPFAELLRLVEARAGGVREEGDTGAAPPPVQRVLIPLGRSLQRNAGAPEFFRYPRAIVAVDGEPAAAAGPPALWLKDRLFLGYHERAAVLEVIGYNEAAGRFEFQLVRDYRPGGRPELVYAKRAVCTACHQGASPIFARGLWDETQANPAVAAGLAATGRDFYGIPLAQGVDVPYRIDAATDRANRLAATQKLWREGCGDGPRADSCRAAALVAALQSGLAGAPGLPIETRSRRFAHDFTTVASGAWAQRWPAGLRLPDPDLPNRDPLRRSGPESETVPLSAALGRPEADLLRELVRLAPVPVHLEPLRPRPPLETWKAEEAAARLVAGLADFFAAGDLAWLDRALFEAGSAPGRARERLAAPCELTARRSADGAVERLKFRCASSAAPEELRLEGRVSLDAGRVTAGALDRLQVGGGGELAGVRVTAGEDVSRGAGHVLRLVVAQGPSGLRVRRPDGDAIEQIEIAWEHGPGEAGEAIRGEAKVAVLDDFSFLEAAVEALLHAPDAGDAAFSRPLGDGPFRRLAVLAGLASRLGLPPPSAGWPDATDLPPPRLEAPAESAEELRLAADPELSVFVRYCGECHRTREPAPPNFLAGPPEQVRSHLASCGERILVRLAMWQAGEGQGAKTPMPPPTALSRHDLTPAAWAGHSDLDLLRATVARLLTQDGRPPRLEDLLAQGYDRLRPCLPGVS